MKVFVTGGAGYCGSVLVPDLLSEGHEVTILDTFWFGDFLPNHPNLKKVKGDFRDLRLLRSCLQSQEVVFHLAAIANDASFELDEKLSTSINFDGFQPLVATAKELGIRHFIYASSSSVYGVSDKAEVTEEHELIPLTLYNKYKGMCEPILLELTDNDFVGTVFRPATVCGFSPRQRLDLSVNILTNHAFNNHKIRVFGGTQKRPNLHVKDYSLACRTIMNAEATKVQNQVFNVGSENLSINMLAQIVQEKVANFKGLKTEQIEIAAESSDDLRSYHINSDKIANILNFYPQLTVEDAIYDLCQAFEARSFVEPMSNTLYFNVKRMKELGVE
jgi:nucleoside-diphosphate-sugar epimerase